MEKWLFLSKVRFFRFSIPPTTSRELGDLIIRTLKRNPKERIDYEEFFLHPFLRKGALPLKDRFILNRSSI